MFVVFFQLVTSWSIKHIRFFLERCGDSPPHTKCEDSTLVVYTGFSFFFFRITFINSYHLESRKCATPMYREWRSPSILSLVWDADLGPPRSPLKWWLWSPPEMSFRLIGIIYSIGIFPIFPRFVVFFFGPLMDVTWGANNLTRFDWYLHRHGKCVSSLWAPWLQGTAKTGWPVLPM